MATAPPMLRLPPELMLRVSSFLNTTELGHYRLSCKTVETNLFDSFAREFFTKRQFMIEQVSLEALVGIANHKTLSPYLTGMQSQVRHTRARQLMPSRDNHQPRHSAGQRKTPRKPASAKHQSRHIFSDRPRSRPARSSLFTTAESSHCRHPRLRWPWPLARRT